MDVLMYALGIVLAAVVLAAALLLTVGLYLNYCSRHPSRKFRAEVFVIVTVTVLSLVVRVAIGLATLPENSLAGGVKSFLHALFSAVAGLTFNSLLELGDLQMVNGILASFYYGIIVYASLVFLIVVTVGLSYEFYSRVQMRGLRRRYSCYYIFTAITPDSIILAQDIKRREENKMGASKRRKNFAIIFFEDGQESFSRKNALHRLIMENGFFYYSDFRRTDRGEAVSFLQTFKFRQKDVVGDDNGENRNKLFYVFATGDCGGFEGDNGELVFEDLTAVLKRYVRVDKDGKLINGIPTAVNYFLLTGGEINYESYEFRLQSTVSEHLKSIGINADKKLIDEIKKSLQVNVFNEATLSSQNMVERRKRNLSLQGAGAFGKDILPDGDGVYRIAVLGFGKTGQYAMEELYVQSAHLESKDGKYIPARFIADVYDPTVDDKSGLFAYNHPLIRCINEENAGLSSAKALIARADKVEGQAFEALYGEYAHLTDATRDEAKRYVDENMQFPVVAFHAKSGFTYPFMDSESADAAVNEAVKNNVRAFVVALGDDERDIAMANVLIDAFKRAYVLGGVLPERRVTIYVNLIECRSAGRLNWRQEDNGKFATANGSGLSVVPFGCRDEMFSYSTLVDDYAARLYNFSYDLYTPSYSENEASEKKNSREKFINKMLNEGFLSYCGDERASDLWLKVSPFTRRSNASAQEFSVNYYEYSLLNGGEISDKQLEFLGRVEHERWNRFHIAHGWTYAPYDPKNAEIKTARRAMRQHNCLCTFDVMLDESTKQYDLANVRLGLIEGIVYCGERENYIKTANGDK